MVKDFVNATEMEFRTKADDCDVLVLATTAIGVAYK